MKKYLKRDLMKCFYIIIPVFIGILIYNFYTPMYADDYSYVYSFANRGDKINGISEIFPSMYAHYFLMNGRLVLHFIAQFLLMLGDNVANLINSVAFVALGLLAYFHVYKSFKNVKILPLLFVYFSLFMFTPAFGQSYLWITGASNYLYGPLLFLIYLIPFRLYVDDKSRRNIFKVILSSFVMLVMGAIVGNTNENTAVAAVFITFVYIVYRFIKYKGTHMWAVFALIGTIVSAGFNLFSPGTQNRLGDNKLNFLPINNLLLYSFDLISMFAPLFIILGLLLVAYLSGYKKKSLRFSQCICDAKIEIAYLLVFLASYYSLIVVSTPERVMSGPLIYLTVFILCIYKKCEDMGTIKWNKMSNNIMVTTISLIFLFTYCNNVVPMRVLNAQYENRLYLIEQAKENNEKEIKLPTIYAPFKYSCYTYDGDLSRDSNSWQNRQLARYFDFEKVILDDENLQDWY